MSHRIMTNLLAGLLFLMGSAFASPDVTFVSLLHQMVDLEQLTRFPEPPYSCKQFSSYDRRSTDKNVPTDENWFANGDRGHHLRVEEKDGRQEWVMMDTEGPGAIVRIWSANPQDAGVIRVYIDNEPIPAIEMPLIEMLSGKTWPFVTPISHFASAGWNCYLPIPYQKHCKVTASNPNFYYHINYRTYPAGTTVQSFSDSVAKAADNEIQSVAERLTRSDALDSEEDNRVQRIAISKELRPGDRLTRTLRGPGAVYSLEMRVNAQDIEKVLRACTLEIRFDDARTAQVLTPLGDFFGTAPGKNIYLSLPCGVREDGTFYSHWVMPFRKKATIRVSNLSDEDVHIELSAIKKSYHWDTRSLYFHATWRGEYPIRTMPRQDWTFLHANGKGLFVGDMLHITNPVKQWWGEGDEKIYVDGEEFPSHFGTGSEDYFGYAWGSPQLFSHAYHAQSRCDGPGNYGQTSVNRFHIIDNIPFTKEFQFDIEVWHWADCEIAMATTSYWYGSFQSSHKGKPIAKADLVVVEPPPLPVKRVEGALEGENLVVASLSAGKTTIQVSDEFPWSNAKQLWWTDASPGDTLTVEFPTEKAGQYEVTVVLTKAVDYGIVELRVNDGEPVGPIDCYNDGVTLSDPISLGTYALAAGTNKLQIKILGTNEKAVPKFMFGLDYIKLTAVDER